MTGKLTTMDADAELNVLCGWLPHCKEYLMFLAGVGCGLLSGLLMRSDIVTAGLDGIRELGPTLLNRL